ncbi:hypothetical protein AWH60_10650 [Pseudoalteromonas haloplanktis]|nr:hypothetical protein AWH60_10650 [Pseudoalteromonas haloplanktis]
MELKPTNEWLQARMVENLGSAYSRHFGKEKGRIVYKDEIHDLLNNMPKEERIKIALNTLTIDANPSPELEPEKLNQHINAFLAS